MDNTKRTPGTLEVGLYDPTAEFYCIAEHIAVFDTSPESVARARAVGYEEGGELVAVFGPSNYTDLGYKARTESDANLFTAAPDMLDALCFVRHLYVRYVIRQEKPTAEEWKRFDEITRAAIAKAEGGKTDVQ